MWHIRCPYVADSLFAGIASKVAVMEIKDIRQLSDQELVSEQVRLRRHVYDLRAQAVTEKLENPARITQARRDIARFKTVQNERIAAQAAEA